MRRFSVFPLSHDMETVLHHREMMRHYCIDAVASFWEDTNRLGQYKDKDNLSCVETYEELLQSNNDILLVGDITAFQTNKYPDYIRRAKDRGKQVWKAPTYLQASDPEQLNDVYTLERVIGTNLYNNTIHRIPVPVLAVMGIDECCDKFALQLSIKEYLDAANFKALFICSNPLGALFDMYTIPLFMFERELSFEQKIFGFNQYVFDLYEKEKPDVVIIGIPGGIMALIEDEYNHFFEMAYLITNAVQFDGGFLNVYYGAKLMDQPTMRNLTDFCQMKFSVPIDFVCLARYFPEKQSSNAQYDYYYIGPYFKDKILAQIQQSCVAAVSLCDVPALHAKLCAYFAQMENAVHAV
nr:hypothetical protein [Maliibacterium massiliense]